MLSGEIMDVIDWLILIVAVLIVLSWLSALWSLMTAVSDKLFSTEKQKEADEALAAKRERLFELLNKENSDTEEEELGKLLEYFSKNKMY